MLISHNRDIDPFTTYLYLDLHCNYEELFDLTDTLMPGIKFNNSTAVPPSYTQDYYIR